MKSIYILLTKSDTYVSRIIGLTTSAAFTHISISFERSLVPMYSFSRKRVNLPLPAGLRIEPLDYGFFSKYDYIPCALYELKVDDAAFESAKEKVDRMMDNAEEYRFSVMGMLMCFMHIPFNRKHHYFCSQFVSEVLTESEAMKLPKPPCLMRPADYALLPGLLCLFSGRLSSLPTEAAVNKL